MRLRDEQKKLLITQKAIEMIVKDGFDGLSMQKLAKAANVSPATLYIYFEDRDDLVRQVAIHAVDQMISSTLTGFDPHMSFPKGLAIQWENRMKYWLENPVQARFMEQIRHSPLGVDIFKKVKREFSVIMKEFVHGAVKRGELVKLPLEIYWSVAFAPLYQLIKFHTDGRGMHDKKFTLDKKVMKTTLKLVIKALTP
jgi:TetR/AcrR family transcriptional regulator, multidrug resistance operon repressor